MRVSYVGEGVWATRGASYLGSDSRVHIPSPVIYLIFYFVCANNLVQASLRIKSVIADTPDYILCPPWGGVGVREAWEDPHGAVAVISQCCFILGPNQS